ncbi:MAG: hypothetical protein AAGA60_09285 [Cyanobacteria bacterium P01_E01_bin.42]
MISTQYSFTLPKGLIDKEGKLYRNGIMRLATGADEISIQKHPLVLENPAYRTLVILSRTIVQLEELSTISIDILEDLFLIDSDYLQDFYNQINGWGAEMLAVGE